MPWIAAVVGAVASAYSANRQASAAKKAGKGAGEVDITSTRTPWGPSEDYRKASMARADALGKRDFPTFGEWGGGGGRAGGGGGGGKKRGGGGGGARAGGGTQPGFTGVSPETTRVRNEMIERAEAGNPLYGVGEDWISGTLQGEDQNKYREETFGALRDVGDEDLDKFKGILFDRLEGGGGSGGAGGRGGSRGYGGFPAYSPGGGGGAAGGGGVASYLKPILEGQYLKEGNPYLEDRVKQALEDADIAYNREKIAGLNSEFSGAGALGSSFYQQALANAAGEKARGLSGTAGALRFEDYDKRMQDFLQAAALQAQIEGDERAAGAAGAGAAASAQAAADRLALEREMGIISALGGAIGEGVDLRQFGLTGMAGLSEGFGQDQRFALEGLPAISGLSLRDWGAAGDLSLGADELQGRYDLGRRDIQGRNAASNRAANLANRQFQFDVYRDERGFPLVQEGGVADIIARMSDPYGTTREVGIDRRSQSPYMGPSPSSAAIAGGIAGGIQGYNWGSQFRGGGGGSAPLSGNQARPSSYDTGNEPWY